MNPEYSGPPVSDQTEKEECSSATPDIQQTPGQEQTNSADVSVRTRNYQERLYEQRRAELVALIGPEAVQKMENDLIDDYLIYGVRRPPDAPPLVGLFHPSGDSHHG